jgi:hypothetical protein
MATKAPVNPECEAALERNLATWQRREPSDTYSSEPAYHRGYRQGWLDRRTGKPHASDWHKPVPWIYGYGNGWAEGKSEEEETR